MPNHDLSEAHERALSYIGNNEIKGLAYVAMTELAPVTYVGIQKAVEEATSQNVDSFLHKTPYTFMAGEFAEYELLMGGNRRPTRHFSPLNEAEALPIIGATLQWSAEHEPSLTEILGTTSSSSTRSPLNSLAIFEALLNGNQPSAIANRHYPSKSTGTTAVRNSRLRQLIDNGVIISEQPDNRFRILSPHYRYRKSLELLGPESQTAYRTLAQASETAPEDYWSVDDLVHLAVTENLMLEQTDTAKLKALFISMASKAIPRCAPGTIEKIDIQKGASYTLNPAYETAVTGIVEHLAQLRTHSSRRHYTDQAKEIFHDMPTAQNLVLKAVRTSPFAKSVTVE